MSPTLMSPALPLISPSLVEQLQITEPYMVVIFNDDELLFETVIAALILATGCSEDEATLEAQEADARGKATVHYAGREECQEAADVLARAGVPVEVCKEWVD